MEFTNLEASLAPNLTMQVKCHQTGIVDLFLFLHHTYRLQVTSRYKRESGSTRYKNLRKWHRDAAIRAVKAGFDIVYVYAGHQLSTISHFLSRYRNRRSDHYGGSLENRARLLREILADTKDAVGHTCGVAIRFAVDELKGSMGFTSTSEGYDLIEMLAEEPDLWDVNISSWEHDSATSRFKQSGYQDDYVSFVKKITTKPVVGVGRYTSPDAMVSLVKTGQLDMIGAARPSIADPFLPKKIEEGRVKIFENALAAIYAFQVMKVMCPLGVLKIQLWEKSGEEDGTQSELTQRLVMSAF